VGDDVEYRNKFRNFQIVSLLYFEKMSNSDFFVLMQYEVSFLLTATQKLCKANWSFCIWFIEPDQICIAKYVLLCWWIMFCLQEASHEEQFSALPILISSNKPHILCNWSSGSCYSQSLIFAYIARKKFH
jgi:hypothetical protein